MHTVKDSEVLVVSREISKYRKVSQALRALIVGWKESFFSYLVYWRDEMVAT